MASSAQQRVLDLLKGMSQCGLDAANELLWTELNYDRVARTLSTHNWSQRAAATLQQDPILLAQAGPSGSTFDAVYTQLSRLHQRRGFPLSIGDERPIVNQVMPSSGHKMTPL